MIDAFSSQDVSVDQSANAPAAGATIASTVLPVGTYQVSWTLELTGTPGAGDADNVQLVLGATQVDQSVNAGAVGTYGPFTTQVEVDLVSQTLAAKAIGNAVAGSVYRVKLTVTAVGQQSATILDGSQPVGFISMAAGLADTEPMPQPGVDITNSLHVQTTRGTISGVLWYYLASDLYGDSDDSEYAG